jgi:subtilase family serine protease
VAETNEANNTRCTAATIVVGEPDLITTAVTPNAATVSGTSTLSVTNSVQNQGTAPDAVSFKVGFKLSPTADYNDPGAVASATTRTVSTLAIGATSTATTTIAVAVTTPPGDYYVCAKADSASAVTELDETNNSSCSAGTVSVLPSDLLLTAISSTVQTVPRAANFSLTGNTIQNAGSGMAGPSGVQFHLSTNTTYGDGDDIVLTPVYSVASMAAGSSSPFTATVQAPVSTPVGTYYLCAMADYANAVTESNEANNTRCTTTPTITVALSDLIITVLTTSTTTVNQGGSVLIPTQSVKNQGLVTTGASFGIRFTLSTNTTYGDGDDVSFSGAVVRTNTAIAAGATSSFANMTLTVSTTTPPGTYYVCAMADYANVISESNETNNTLCTATQITVPPPDLIVSAISTGATSIAPGASFGLSNSVKNQGGASAGSSTVGFHLSTNTIYGDGDDVASTTTRTITSLAINATSTVTTTVSVPVSTPAGIYYICAMADVNNTVTESNETNNSLCTTTTIAVGPDLIINSITTAATHVAQNANFQVTDTVRNAGNAVTPLATTNAYHLSTDNVYGNGDDVVISQTRLIGTLAGGGNNTGTPTLTVPLATPNGTYRICVMADSTLVVAEQSETNNTLCTSTTIIVP